MPDLLKAAQDDLAAIYFHYKPGSKEWRAAVAPIHALRPIEQPDVQTRAKVPRRRAQ